MCSCRSLTVACANFVQHVAWLFSVAHPRRVFVPLKRRLPPLTRSPWCSERWASQLGNFKVILSRFWSQAYRGVINRNLTACWTCVGSRFSLLNKQLRHQSSATLPHFSLPLFLSFQLFSASNLSLQKSLSRRDKEFHVTTPHDIGILRSPAQPTSDESK